MLTKILPFTHPIITSYPGVCNTLAIISHDLDFTAPWICDRYIQLMSVKGWEQEQYFYGTFYEEQIGLPAMTQCPFIKALSLEKKTLFKFDDDIVEFIKHYIKNDYIIDFFVDHFYITSSSAYQKTHRLHPVLINGFSEEEGVFFSTDFFSGKYSTIMIPYDEIKKSYSNSLDSDILFSQNIGMIKYQRVKYEMDYELIKTSLEDYLNCRDSFMKYKHSLYLRNKFVFYGLNYYKAVDETLQNSTTFIDYRMFQVLFDHKVIMNYRLNYFFKVKLLNEYNYAILTEKGRRAERESFVLRNLVLKYNVNQNETLLSKIKEKSISLCSLDEEMTINLLKCI